ncbi:hypothetical protein C6W27_08945 [Bacillus paralicheniformis]|uniref:hypothetical protein n=1 Tax=Bacillus paralicheniformis TaxID=1648923 RepID=UPI000D02E89B|nr:hypothetical protein [Bacillus paralicheniformis]PRS16517.1 hypothetical protein C6W27_08945 [Bacillus paralicheniformis]
MTQYSNDRLLLKSIDIHRKIVNGATPDELAKISIYEKDAPIDRIHQYNAFMILSKLEFSKDEVLNKESKSRAYLDEVSKDNPSEQILDLLLKYREEISDSAKS